MNIKKDYYKILGVIPDAELVVIRAAYKALVNVYHPDRNDDPKSKEKIREINIAYEILSDPYKKAEYDKEIEELNSDAGISEFETNAPFTDENIEQSWTVATEFYPSINKHFNNLVNISWRLAFAYKLHLLETKDYKNEKNIASNMKYEYLSKYFGKDKWIVSYAEKLIVNKFIDEAIELNTMIKVMGKSISLMDVKDILNKKYPNIEKGINGNNYYQKIKGNSINDSVFYAEKLVDLFNGKIETFLFNQIIILNLNDSIYQFKNKKEFCDFVLKKYADKYN